MTRCELFMECGAVETKKGWEGAERSNIIIIIVQPVATWSFTRDLFSKLSKWQVSISVQFS